MQKKAENLGDALPSHVVIIMDGNGRWAKKRLMPRFAGHKAGVKSARTIIQSSGKLGIKALTLFAFSSENWRRPRKEVETLMDLFISSLNNYADELHQNNVCLQFIGDRLAFTDKLQQKMAEVEMLTANNSGLRLNIAANYGGRWDITQAVKQCVNEVLEKDADKSQIDEACISSHISMSDLPEPDLFIRTGGERRISNFLMWQLAYTELYFTDVLWPDFGESEYQMALQDYAGRQRRFGKTGEQVEQADRA